MRQGLQRVGKERRVVADVAGVGEGDAGGAEFALEIREVRVVDLAGGERPFIVVAHFLAGGEGADLGQEMDGDLVDAGCGERGEVAAVQPRALRDQQLAGAEVFTGAPQVVAGRQRLADADGCRPALCVTQRFHLLDRDHGVAAGRYRGTGHDLDRAARAGGRGQVAGGKAGADREREREVRRLRQCRIQGEAVHRRIVERRDVDRSDEIGRRDLPAGVAALDDLHRLRLRLGDDQAQRLPIANHA